MATKIDMCSLKAPVRAEDLSIGDCFIVEDRLLMCMGWVYTANGDRSNCLYVVEMQTGYFRKIGKLTKVEPVDIEIKVVRK